MKNILMVASDNSEPIWSVVCVAKENPAVIRRFVAWHLHAGASKVTIFFDDPNDPCVDLLLHLPQVVSVRCTTDFWQSLSVSPDALFIRRQNQASKFGYMNASEGWVLNLDADELMYVKGQSVGSLLATMSAETQMVQVCPVERVLPSGATDQLIFRGRHNREQTMHVHGDLGPALVRNYGMVGHSAGKSFIRTGLVNFRMRQHFIQALDGREIISCEIGALEGAYLLHFYNQDYADWRRKLHYRVAQRGFRNRLRQRLKELLENRDENGMRAMFERLHHVDSNQLAFLQRENLVISPVLNLDSIISKYF